MHIRQNSILTAILLLFCYSVATKAANTSSHTYTWSSVSTGIVDESTGGVCCPDGRLLFSFSNRGVVSSSDNGKHWAPTSTNIGKGYVGFECLSTDSSGAVYLGVSRYPNRYETVYKLNNKTASWKLIKPGIRGSDVYALAFGRQGRLYALLPKNSLYVSDDRGKHWKKLCGSIAVSLMSANITINSQGDVFSTLDRGIYRCRAGRNNWEKVDLGPIGGWVTTVVCDKKNQLFAGVNASPKTDKDHPYLPPTGEPVILRSADGGKHWARFLPSHECTICESIAFGTKNEVIAGTDRGVFISYDGGSHWNCILNDSIARYPAYITRVITDSNNCIYAVTVGGDIYTGVPGKAN